MNDSCAAGDTIVLDSCGSMTLVTVNGDTEEATASGLGTFCGTSSSATSADLWYTLIGTGDSVTATTCGTASFDTKIQVYSGADCGSLTCVDGNDDFCGTQSAVTWQTELDTVYHIQVYGFGTATGSFTLTVIPTTDTTDGTGCGLPVEWLSFEAEKVGQEVKLDWSTASEINNSHFLVQRSSGGKSFRNIGTVQGSGSVSYQVDYQFTDAAPFAGRSYYRLKQVDFDGNYDYSELRDVLFGGTQQLSINPNPFNNNLSLSISSETVGEVSIEIFNSLGQVIWTKYSSLKKGTSTHEEVTDGSWPQGTYFVKALINGEMQSLIWLKTKR